MKMEYTAQVLRGWPADGSLERAELINTSATLSNGTLVQMQTNGTVDVSGLTTTRKAGLVLRGNGDSSSAKNASGIWMVPQPALSITAISAWVAPGFLTITTGTVAHGYNVGNQVTIAAVTTTAVNGTYNVESVVDQYNFTVELSTNPGAITVGSGTATLISGVATNGKALVLWGNYIVATTNYNTTPTYVPGSPVTASAGQFTLANGAAGTGLVPTATVYSASAYLPNTVQVTLGAPHGFSSGQQVTMAGVTPAGYNGTFTITVNGPTTFTYYLSSNPGLVTVAGTVTVQKDPEIGYVLRVQGAGSTETAHLNIVVY